jgi:flagellar biosynthesis GTPase FlhF
VEKTKEHEKLLADKKVFVLFGSTGVGKSTSIYFLSG